MWIDRLLMLLEIIVLLYMLRLDKRNSEAIALFLRERTAWYNRRAQLKTEKAPKLQAPLETENETVAVLSEDGHADGVDRLNEPQQPE